MEITTHPGIGDISWVYSKLVNCGEDLDIIIAEDAKTKRAAPLCDLLPNVKSVEYGTKADYIPLKDAKNCDFETYKRAESKGLKLYVSANNHLENSNRLEGFMPDLPTDFHYEITTSANDKEMAKSLLPLGNVYFGIYTSSQGGVNTWNGWSRFEWIDFIKRIRNIHPHVTFVLIGAKWDIDLTDRLAGDLQREGINHINLCGKTPMGIAVECLKRFAFFAGFASGMGILSNVLSMPQLMLYPSHLEGLMQSWPCPVSLATGAHQYSLWKRPSDVFFQISPYLKNFLYEAK